MVVFFVQILFPIHIGWLNVARVKGIENFPLEREKQRQKKAVLFMKNRKEAGPDGIPVEVHKLTFYHRQVYYPVDSM